MLAGIDIELQTAEQLRQQGLSREQARRGFQQAGTFMDLAATQQRPGVTAQDIVEATELGIAQQQERLGRIVAQSTSQSAAQLGAARTREGAVTGIVEQ